MADRAPDHRTPDPDEPEDVPLDDRLSQLPDEAWLLALASLPAMGPRRLGALTAEQPARAAWSQVRAGRAHSVRSSPAPGACSPDEHLVIGPQRGPLDLERASAAWSRAAATFDVAEAWRRHRQAGVQVVGARSVGYPLAAMAGDPLPPPVLFAQGDLQVVEGPRVAIVGTRDCTCQGHDFAFELGRDLATAGVRVVSGLALGIDGAAHAGALDAGTVGAGTAPPIAVVGSGLDVIYPRRHASLWRAVAARGLLLGEHPLGVSPTAWHFPARNRLIAALADVVVVVESHERGGSLQTAREALARDREVMAVPGPVRSRASAGVNLLLRDGAGVCLGAHDVLALLGLSAQAVNRRVDDRPRPDPLAAQVLAALGGQSSSIEQLVLRTGLHPTEVAVGVSALEAGGWVTERGGWYEPSGPRP